MFSELGITNLDDSRMQETVSWESVESEMGSEKLGEKRKSNWDYNGSLSLTTLSVLFFIFNSGAPCFANGIMERRRECDA